MRNPARDEADRWTTALGVPAGTEPEDAVRMVQRRAFRWLLESDDAADIALDVRDAEIQRGKHVRDQTTHPDPSSAARG